MPKVIGNTTATPTPQADWNQTNTAKPDYIKNKPEILTEEQIIALIEQHGGSAPQNVYTKEEIDAALGSYITEIDALIGEGV